MVRGEIVKLSVEGSQEKIILEFELNNRIYSNIYNIIINYKNVDQDALKGSFCQTFSPQKSASRKVKMLNTHRHLRSSEVRI